MMKRPFIKIFGNIHKVILIEYNNEDFIEKIVYEGIEKENKTIFRSNKVLSSRLNKEIKIQKPTVHPYHGYILAPNLESLLVPTV